MTKPLFSHALPVLFTVALLAGCNSGPDAASPAADDAAPLAGSSIGGPFTLVNSNGETVHWKDYDPKYRIVYFGYTYCPDACPLDVSQMMKGYNAFKQTDPQLAAKVQPIFISIDPKRDTPEKVGEFAHAFSDDLIGLTGTPEQVDQAARAFKIYYAKDEDAGNGSYLMNHSRMAYLMGPNGNPVDLLPIDQGPDAVAADLKKWVS